MLNLKILRTLPPCRTTSLQQKGNMFLKISRMQLSSPTAEVRIIFCLQTLTDSVTGFMILSSMFGCFTFTELITEKLKEKGSKIESKF